MNTRQRKKYGNKRPVKKPWKGFYKQINTTYRKHRSGGIASLYPKPKITMPYPYEEIQLMDSLFT